MALAQDENNEKQNKFILDMENGITNIDKSIGVFGCIGEFALYLWHAIIIYGNKFYKNYARRYVYKIDAFGLKIVRFFSKIYRFISFKFYMFFKFFVDIKNVIKNGYNKDKAASGGKKVLNALYAFCKGTYNNRHLFITTINYALPVIAISIFASLISYVSGLNFGVAVEYNGEHVGYIQDESVFENAEAKLQERMIYMENDVAVEAIPKFTVALINDETLKSDVEMTDTIIQNSAGDIVKATGLSIDGEFYGAVKNGAELQTELNQILDKYKTNVQGEEVAFAKDVKTETGFFVAANIVDENEVFEKITRLEQKDVYYEVESGDTPIMIATKNNMELDDVVALNKDILTNCKIGKQVLVKKSQSFLPVKVTRSETYSQPIKYDTEFVESKKLYKGQQQVAKTGVAGSQVVIAKVSYVDGGEVSRDVISTSVITQPVAEVITKGILEMPKISTVTSGKVSNSGFIWPVWGGYISQNYGSGHNGIDYAYRGNGYGKPIVATLPGTVTFAGYNGSYGKLVIVESPGGIQTWYAHSSKLLVSRGQQVAQGQQLANIGSTGNSTGNHLHFRVIIGGVEKNPRNYLP